MLVWYVNQTTFLVRQKNPLDKSVLGMTSPHGSALNSVTSLNGKTQPANKDHVVRKTTPNMQKLPKMMRSKIKGCSAYSFNCLGCWSSSPPTSTIPFSLTLPVNLIHATDIYIHTMYTNKYNGTAIIIMRRLNINPCIRGSDTTTIWMLSNIH